VDLWGLIIGDEYSRTDLSRKLPLHRKERTLIMGITSLFYIQETDSKMPLVVVNQVGKRG
jgi:hypothetical protein